MTPEHVYRTVIVVEVFTRGTFESTIGNNWDLESLASMIEDDNEGVATWRVVDTRAMPAARIDPATADLALLPSSPFTPTEVAPHLTDDDIPDRDTSGTSRWLRR